ncbi:uncharacterized protein LOC110606098 isoform X2 [Manihot esculenta]|uniref:Nucleoplasmin-like domain-containing protein n=1 Tax=Manihot esculenta TaxID=3983 RepID=A0A2C9U3G6_MANES|nr:uncharacterized protein LOC110606098 isoform X2 [Manihot esculenta]
MASWGASIPCGGSFTQRCENPPRRFRITKATLMKRVQWYLVEGWTSVECRIGDKQPVYLCSLNQGSVSLEVEFEESEDIIFRARGYRGVRLSGYYVSQSTETDLCEVKAAEDARSYYNALRPCKCMETCTNGAMLELENDKVESTKHLENGTDNNVEGSRSCNIQKDEICEGEVVHSKHLEDIASDMEDTAGLRNNEVDCVHHLEEDIVSDVEGSEQQIAIVERTCDVQIDEAVQDADILGRSGEEFCNED